MYSLSVGVGARRTMRRPFDGEYGAFVSKLAADGGTSVYSTSNGGAHVASRPQGDALVTGRTASANHPTSRGAFDTTFTGGTDAFVAKLDG